jgi:hypothetical protein
VLVFVAARVGIPNVEDICLRLSKITPGDAAEHRYRFHDISVTQRCDLASVCGLQVLEQHDQCTALRTGKMQATVRGEILIGPRLVSKILQQLWRIRFGTPYSPFEAAGYGAENRPYRSKRYVN